MLGWTQQHGGVFTNGDSAGPITRQGNPALPDPERQELAREVLPLLLTTRAGLEEIDRSLEALSDEELDAIIERARQRAGGLGDEAVAAIIAEAVRAVRAQSRS